MIDEPHPKHAMAFFDGQNLFQHAKDAFGHYHPNYDPIKLHRLVCEMKGWKPSLVRFYSGVPPQARSPMWSGYWSNRVIAMKRAGIHVTTRVLRYRDELVEVGGEQRTVSTPQEKGIDVRIALDLVSCALSGQFDVAVIYSQDQDLCEAVEEVKGVAQKTGRSLEIACAFPFGPKASSKRGIDRTEWIRIEEGQYNACLDPKDYRPKN